MWISAIVEWDKLTQAGKKQMISAMVSGDVLDKIALMEPENKELMLAIIANKGTYPITLEFLQKNPNEEVRKAVMQRKSIH